MRIVLAPDGSRGDMEPMFALGERLVAEGHTVRMCAPPGFGAEARALGLDFTPLPFDAEAFMRAHGGEITRGGFAGLRTINEAFTRAIASQFEALPEVARAADLIVSAGIQFAGASVARAVGAEHVMLMFAPTLLASDAHPPPMLGYRRLPATVNRLAWRAAESFYDRLLGSQMNQGRARLGLPPAERCYDTFIGPRVALVCDPELGPAPNRCRVEVVQLGALTRAAHRPLDTRIEAFLENGMKPIYVGFGSMPDHAPERTTERIVQAATSAGVRVVLGSGWAGLGKQIVSEQVLVVDYVPHGSLFPRVAAAIHHGGAGTTAMAARAGIAQLVIPHNLDQPYFGHRVAALGIGPAPIPRSKLTAARLQKAMRQLVEAQSLQHRATKLARALRSRDPLTAAITMLTTPQHEARV